MESLFSADFFKGNRQRLTETISETVPVVITANGQLQRNSDTTYPFRQDSSFWYLTGINDPDVVLVIDAGKEYLIIPDQTDYQHIFDGTINISKLKESSGINEIVEAKEGWKRFHNKIKQVKQVATLAAPPAFVDTYGMFTNPARSTLLGKLREVNPALELVDLRPLFNRMRSIKQPIELKAIQRAIKLTSEAIISVKNHLSDFEYEYEIEAEIISHFLKNGSTPAWKPTVSAGINATTLHYRDNDSRLISGELLLLDIGAEVDNYASDISRTLVIKAKPTTRQERILEAVLEVHEFASRLLKPGVLIKEYEKEIEVFMGKKLQELSLIKTIDRQSVRKYYPHATSHFLGLDAHDVGEYDKPLEAGMVLTIEPGIYIPEENIGIRIEDDVLITDAGIKNLSDNLEATF